MKYLTIGVFAAREDAEKAINMLHGELGISNDNISYVYKNTDNETLEVSAGEISETTPKEGAKSGAVIGGSLGALAGIATVAGVIPVVGPIFAAGPLMAALGLTGAIGTTAAGAVTGAAAGGLIGALVNLGVGEERAKRYADRVTAGNILVTAYAEENQGVIDVMTRCGANDVERFSPVV